VRRHGKNERQRDEMDYKKAKMVFIAVTLHYSLCILTKLDMT